eukprot:1159086-Pelagomonas_calceolata.AAC.15
MPGSDSEGSSKNRCCYFMQADLATVPFHCWLNKERSTWSPDAHQSQKEKRGKGKAMHAKRLHALSKGCLAGKLGSHQKSREGRVSHIWEGGMRMSERKDFLTFMIGCSHGHKTATTEAAGRRAAWRGHGHQDPPLGRPGAGAEALVRQDQQRSPAGALCKFAASHTGRSHCWSASIASWS